MTVKTVQFSQNLCQHYILDDTSPSTNPGTWEQQEMYYDKWEPLLWNSRGVFWL